MAEAPCTCSIQGDGPSIDCQLHGQCATYGHPCHCGAISGTERSEVSPVADKRVAAAAWAIYSDFRRAQSGDPYLDRVWINRYIQRQTAVRYARVALAAADALESGDSQPGGRP